MTTKYKYTMAVNVELVLGTAQKFRVREWVDVDFDPEHRSSNVPSPNFVWLRDLKVDNMTVLPSDEKGFSGVTEDAFAMQTARGGAKFEPAPCRHGITVDGEYSGLVPEGCVAGQKFLLCIMLSGYVAQQEPRRPS